jgi:elongation factor P
MVIRYNNDLWTITEFHHVSPGNWRAFVRTRLKNLKNGRVIEQRFNAGEAIDEVRVEHQNWQFLYVDGDDYVFMNTDTFDQQPIRKEMLGDGIKFIKEGDTANNVTKPATLETGSTVNVPLFVNPGDKIRIDTRTGQYVSRVK